MRSFHQWLLAALLLGGWAAPAAPAPVPLEHLAALGGDYFPMRSAANGRRYHIYVRLPEGYGDAPKRTYPTVYLLDGDSTFPMLAPQHLFLTYDDKLPEAILVGIAFGSFAPPANSRGPDFGPEAAAFQRFLKDELIPEVERRVRSDPARRILVGQSRGGGFVLYSAFTDPGLFWGRIASNPSFPDYKPLLFAAAPAGRVDSRLIVASGTRDWPQLRADALAWFAAHQGRPTPWLLKRIDIDGGTHAADLPNAYRRAMNWLFNTPAD
ncbi:MAG TPA: alpha/beta hydrolase-fold protein [Sphingomicrobium sp.]|nr:alpha/beta hydrolase-fold protein [Sphingomicrobium sp.]